MAYALKRWPHDRLRAKLTAPYGLPRVLHGQNGKGTACYHFATELPITAWNQMAREAMLQSLPPGFSGQLDTAWFSIVRRLSNREVGGPRGVTNGRGWTPVYRGDQTREYGSGPRAKPRKIKVNQVVSAAPPYRCTLAIAAVVRSMCRAIARDGMVGAAVR